ncbi:MAG: porin, partial [Vibrio sp.]
NLSPTTLAVLIATSALSTQVYASGFQVGEHSATGLGRAFAGEAAIADNAAVLSRNPAGMTRIKKPQVSGALTYVNPEIDLTDYQYNQKANDIAPTQFVPASYYVAPINDQWTWGLGLFSTYGFATDYPTSMAAGQNAGYSSIETVTFNPSIAYRLNDHLSFGAGFDLVYAKAELERRAGILGAISPALDPSSRLIKLRGEDFGYGWNVGALYEVNENHRFGVAYRSSIHLDFDDGKVYDYAGTAGLGGGKHDANLKLNLPDVLEVSGFHQVSDQWAVHYSYMWTNWSRFTQILATDDDCVSASGEGICLQKKENYHDSNRWSIGATYDYNQDWTFRAGFAYDEQAGEPTISIPDSDRYWYSVGSTYNWSENLSFDTAFTYIDSDEQRFEEKGSFVNGPYKSKGPAYLVAAQVNYTF